MPDTFLSRLRHAWYAFQDRDPTEFYTELGPAYSSRPDKRRLNTTTEKTIVSGIYTRMAIDVSSIGMQHIRVDQNGRYLETINSGLNTCLSLQANIDQTGRDLLRDIVLSMFDEGCVAIVPVETTINPKLSGSYDITSMRTGKIVQWYPQHVRLSVYNDRIGRQEEITLPKSIVAIVENPLYSVMNEPNSTLKRLIHKLNILDVVDEQSGSGKLDLIIQLPYVIKTEQRKAQAEQRRKDITDQLKDSKYGIAYTDGTEKVTQLNRPAENNLMAQIEFLTRMLYSQLGLTENIFNGTANEEELLNYFNRTVNPILLAICDAMICKFITKTGRTQGQTIGFFRNPFSLVPAKVLAEMADKFTRNAILSSNEFRGVMGYKPSNDPEADKLSNKNLNSPSKSPTQNDAPAENNPENIDTEGVDVNDS